METDFTLLQRWKAGDLESGNALFERHFDSVYRFFAHKVEVDVAADLVQRTFLGCVEGLSRFREDSTFRTFVFAIARNELFGHFRRRRRSPELDVGGSSIRDLAPSPSTLLGHDADQRLLLEALRSIPLDLQIVLELHYWEELSGPELARALEVPEGTVRSRLHRARELLRARLEELGSASSALASTLQDLEKWAGSLRSLRAAVSQR
jgi:RNA polymerase sigma factor (sigma-70 family)